MKVVLTRTAAALEEIQSEVATLRKIRDGKIGGCLALAESFEDPCEDGTVVFVIIACAPGLKNTRSTHTWRLRHDYTEPVVPPLQVIVSGNASRMTSSLPQPRSLPPHLTPSSRDLVNSSACR
jgi:hypothetical protein